MRTSLMNVPGLLIDAYVATTFPIRSSLRKSLARVGRLPVTILFFHRVADLFPNDWTMPTATFDRLIDWLPQHCDLISLGEAQRRLQTGDFGSKLSVSLTFDDGYADNCQHAIPTLLRHQIPFTYFVSTNFIGTQHRFPHDARRGFPLQPNSVNQIREMADAGVEIGVHTRSHADMGAIFSAAELESEIAGARADVEAWIKRTPKYFAFPYGFPDNLNEQAIRILHQLGFDGFCSAYGCYNHPFDDPFHLQRFHADPSLARVRNWLTLDPRWLRKPRQFQYELKDNVKESLAHVS